MSTGSARVETIELRGTNSGGPFRVVTAALRESGSQQRAERLLPSEMPQRWAVPGSNGRPPACKAGALPTELTAQTGESSIRPLERSALLEGARGTGGGGGDPLAILALTLDHDFFEDWGWLVGPVIWLACSAITGRILSLPLTYVLFSAVAGGVAGLIVMLATSHTPGLIASLLVFAASCGSYDPSLEPEYIETTE